MRIADPRQLRNLARSSRLTSSGRGGAQIWLACAAPQLLTPLGVERADGTVIMQGGAQIANGEPQKVETMISAGIPYIYYFAVEA